MPSGSFLGNWQLIPEHRLLLRHLRVKQVGSLTGSEAQDL